MFIKILHPLTSHTSLNQVCRVYNVSILHKISLITEKTYIFNQILVKPLLILNKCIIIINVLL